MAWNWSTETFKFSSTSYLMSGYIIVTALIASINTVLWSALSFRNGAAKANIDRINGTDT